MASLTRWTWVWVNSGSWWWTGRPGVLRFMGWQSWTWLSEWTELNWIKWHVIKYFISTFQTVKLIENSEILLLGETHWLKPSTLARHHSNHLHSCFMTGGPSKEQETNKPPPTGRVQERSKGGTTYLTTSQNPCLWHPSWLNKACTTRKNSESKWLAKDNWETNPITIKPKTGSQVAELFSWVPLPRCSWSPPWCPFSIKFLALSVHVSPRTICFQVLDKSPVSGPGRCPPFLQHYHHQEEPEKARQALNTVWCNGREPGVKKGKWKTSDICISMDFINTTLSISAHKSWEMYHSNVDFGNRWKSARTQ